MRRTLSAALPALLLLFALGCTTQRSRPDPVAGRPLDTPERPNIIYILADDLGYADLGCYGQERVQTPSLDALAARGLRFTQHYAGSTVCGPSRCVLMTGKHTGHGFTRGNLRTATGYEPPLPAGEVTIPMLLKQAGYRTACIGKWGLGGPNSTGHPNAVGFDDFYGFLNHQHAHNHYPDFLWRNGRRELTGNVMTDESRIGPTGAGVAVERHAYADDLFFEEAQKFIADEADTRRPFFLYLALTVPHTNNEAPRLLDLMPEDARPQQGQEVPGLGPYAGTNWPGPQKGTAAMISRMDAGIGALLQQLESLGIADNTLVLFSSDNGPHAEGGNDPTFFDSNGPLRGIKRDLYEGGVRVPMIAVWPGRIRPGVTDHISAFQDVMPTLCELVDINTPATIDGISFLPTLTGEGGQRSHDYLYWEFYEQQGKQAVRLGDFKGVRLKVHESMDNPIELYDLSRNPGEQTNIADRRPEVVAQIQTIMIEARTRSGVEAWRFDGEK